MDVDQALPRSRHLEEAVAAAGDLAQAGTHHQEQVGLLDPSGELGVGRDADVAGVVRMAVVEVVAAAERISDRQVEGLGEGPHIGGAGRAPPAAAEDREGPLGRAQHLAQAGHVVGSRMGPHRLVGLKVVDLDPVAQHIFRERQDHRPRPAGGRRVEGAAHELGNPRGVVDLGDPLAERAKHAPEIDLLKGLAFLDAARHLTHEEDHRGGILERHVDARRGIRRARAPGDETDPRPPGQLAVGFGHHGAAAFLPADDELDLRRVVERVEHRQIALAGHPEDELHPVNGKLIHQDATAAPQVAALGHGSPFHAVLTCLSRILYLPSRGLSRARGQAAGQS